MGWTTLFYDKIKTMAFISVETKAEVTMVKILSSMNQILLCHCFVMVFFGLLAMADTEAGMIMTWKTSTTKRAYSWNALILFQAFYRVSLPLLLELSLLVEEDEYC